ncbi:MAG: YciI family protein [Bacteroidota bacterium]
MAKKTFFLKLNPPRPSFTLDMTEEEGAIMVKHVEYWKPHIQAGTAVVIGLVGDPKGGYGVGIVQVEDEERLNDLISNDPANGLHSYEVHPIRAMSTMITEQ